MKKYFVLLSLISSVELIAQTTSPDVVLQELFRDVQLSGIYKDSKTFADAIPKKDPKQILADYRRIRSNPAIRFSLQRFVESNFTLPDTATVTVATGTSGKSVRAHIKNLWRELHRKADVSDARSSLLPLPYSYIVPGGRFREIYYWDSYFTMLGLYEDGLTELSESMVKNFASLIDKHGFIPNGNRSYYLTRSQPPFFAEMVKLLAAKKGANILIQYLPQLEKEYNYWMQKNKSAISIASFTVNRYWDDRQAPRAESYAEDVQTAKTATNPLNIYQNLRAAAASGWDFSSRWMTNNQLSSTRTLDIIPVDLNALLYNLERTIAEAHKLKGNTIAEKKYSALAEQRKRFLILYCWSAKDGYFYDYDYRSKKQTNIKSLATAYPLFFRIATDVQAKQIAANLEKEFLKPGGFTTTLSNTGQQWDAPNGWAPLQWITIQGLLHYDQKLLAEKAAKRWIDLNVSVFQRTGRFMEKYNVVDLSLPAGGGEYPTQDGFGWTNGVLLKLMNIFKYEGTLPATKTIPMYQ